MPLLHFLHSLDLNKNEFLLFVVASKWWYFWLVIKIEKYFHQKRLNTATEIYNFFDKNTITEVFSRSLLLCSVLLGTYLLAVVYMVLESSGTWECYDATGGLTCNQVYRDLSFQWITLHKKCLNMGLIFCKKYSKTWVHFIREHLKIVKKLLYFFKENLWKCVRFSDKMPWKW